MAEQNPKLASEIARFNAEAMKLEAEAEEIKKRVGQKWYQGRNAVLLIIQTLIAGIFGAGAFAFALFEFYLPFYKQEVVFAEQRVEIAKQGVEIVKGENDFQEVKLKEQQRKLKTQETKLTEQKAALTDLKGRLETQKTDLKKQEAKLNDQETELKTQVNKNAILESEIEAREDQLKLQKRKVKKAEDQARETKKENKIILAELTAIRAKDSLKAGKKTLSEKDLKSLEGLERKTKELALKAVPPPRAMRVEKLRSKPETLNSKAIFKMVLDKGFSLPGHEIKGSFRHNYEAKTLSGDQVVEDHATGLMWQQGGSAETKTFEETKKYVEDINARKFAGCKEWRLPTIEELISLVEPELPELKDWSWTLFLDKNFDGTQRWIRSADQKGPNNRWGIVFYEGKLYFPTLDFPYYVRLVRSSTPC